MSGKNANQMHLRKQKGPVCSQMQPVGSESITDDRGLFIYPVTQQTVLEAPVPRAQEQLVPTPWTVTYQALLSMGFPRKEYWSWLPCPALGDLPDSGIEPMSPALQEDSLTTEPPGKPPIDF